MGLEEDIRRTIKGQIQQRELQSLIASFNGWANKRKRLSVERYLKYSTGRKVGKKSKLAGVAWLIRNQLEGKDDLNSRVLTVLYTRATQKHGKVAYTKPLTKRKRKTSRIKQRRKEYKQYLKSDWWKVRRYSKVISIGTCEVCGSNKHLLVHHLNYNSLGQERDSDLAVLCKGCHTRLHKQYGRGASFGVKVIKQEHDSYMVIL
jgi:hypothetical protein